MTPGSSARSDGSRLVPALAIGGGAALALALVLLRLFVIEAFKIPAGAMIPTLLVGDHVLVNKLAYRGRPPRRGDVAVFRRDDAAFVSRIVAVGGDTVAFRAGALLLNGAAVPRRERPGSCTQDGADGSPPGAAPRPCRAFEETLDGRSHVVIHDPGAPGRDLEPVTVPAGHCFVVGDNRDNSYDSRYYGAIPVGSLTGRLWRVWWRAAPRQAAR